MSEQNKNKSIQEALAEVQKNAELKRIQEAKKTWGDALQVDEIAMDLPPNFEPPAISGQKMAGTIKRSGKATGRFVQPQRATASSSKPSTASRSVVPSGSRTPATSTSSSSTPSTGGASRAIVPTGSKALDTTASSSGAGRDGKFSYSRLGDKPILSGKEKAINAVKGLGPITAAAIGGAQASNILGGLATGTETGRNIGSWIGKNVPGAKTAAEVMRTAGEKIGVRQPSDKTADSSTPAPSSSAPSSTEKTSGGRTGTGINRVMNREPSAAAAPATPAPSATAKEVPTIKAPAGPAKVAPSAAAPKAAAPSTATSTKGGYFTKSPNVSKGDYTIQKGDTLSGIAKKSGTSVGAIQSMNKGLTDVNKIAAGGSLNLPTTSKSSAPETKTTAATPAPSTPKQSETPAAQSSTPVKDFVKNAMTGNYETPIKDAIKSKLQPEYESGGKKVKKMSEDTNPLIAAFLKLQNENPSNMFEAAKKAKKDYDGDGKVESPKDEVWGSRFKAAKAAGKMEEESVDHLGSSTVTKSKPKEDPSTPKVPYSQLPKPGNAAGDVIAKGKNALDKTGVREEAEEVTFSEAELEHFNSFFPEASVAPNRPEVATGADSTSDKMSQNDVTGTSTESGKRIRKEEIELEEGFAKIVKGIKRSLKGWPAEPLHGSGGNKPKDVVKRTRERSDSDVKSLASDSNKAAEHSPAGLQKNVAKQEMKRRNLEEGRPRKNPVASEEESPTKNIAAQVRTARSVTNDGGKTYHIPLKHPVTGKVHHVPQKAVDDFNKSYAAASKPHEKEAVETSFRQKHMGD